MGRLAAAQSTELLDASFEFAETLDAVRFLMSQLNGLDAPAMARVKVPSGGGIAWVIPNGTESPDVTKYIEGLIIDYHRINAYWNKPREESANAAPFCSSENGISGYDEDGLESPCKTCQRIRLGSAEYGNLRGKAGKNMARILILREGDALPLELIIPAMSLPNYASYIDTLSHYRLTPRDVITRVTLIKTTNKKGDPYSKAQFQAIGKVDKESTIAMRKAVTPLLLTASENNYDDSSDAAKTEESA